MCAEHSLYMEDYSKCNGMSEIVEYIWRVLHCNLSLFQSF